MTIRSELSRRQLPLLLAAALAQAETYDAFHSPQDVAVTGYDGDVMEPFFTRDGRYLLFNNRNEAAENTNLHWAKYVDDLTFQYMGEIPSVNTWALEAVPSLDRDGNLYFVSTRSYEQTRSTIYRAHFRDGACGTPELVEGISRGKPGWVNFDAEISAGGQTLYFVDGYFGSAGYPQKATLVSAERSVQGFRRRPDSAHIFQNINNDGLTYAPNLSTDELELFCTRVHRMEVTAQPAIYRSVRTALDQPFTTPRSVRAIEGFAEASTLSPDERSLYYHARVYGSYRLRRVTRP